MIDSQHPNPFVSLVTRAITILRTEGPTHLVKRIKDRLLLKPLQYHFYVFEYKENPDTPPPICENGLEIKEITAADDDEIDELTEIDEWKTSKSLTLRKLEEGWHVYIAKHKGRIVASQTVVMRDRFDDPAIRREFRLASDEAYYWRSFCIPAYRGRGIFPMFGRYYLTDVARRYGRSHGLIVVEHTNKSMQRACSKYGFKKRIGRIGFIEIFGVRFHYLWGREAFKETRRRFFIQNVG
jgi:GNAT superfamily N-acetyltransferase